MLWQYTHVSFTQCLTPLPVHHAHNKQGVVHLGETKSQTGKGTRPKQINKGAGRAAGATESSKQRRHHQGKVMWGRVKELFRIPALAGMGADKGKEARDYMDFCLGCRRGLQPALSTHP